MFLPGNQVGKQYSNTFNKLTNIIEDDKEGCSQGEEESTENVVAQQAQRRAVDGNARVGSARGRWVKRNSRSLNVELIALDPKDMLLRDEQQILD